jgi:hypothetical protein
MMVGYVAEPLPLFLSKMLATQGLKHEMDIAYRKHGSCVKYEFTWKI